MFELLYHYRAAFFEGFKYTLLASVIVLVASLVLGVCLALLQLSKHRLFHAIGQAVVEFFRNIPLLVVVMFFYVVVPLLGLPLQGFQAGVIGLTLYTSAFIADIVRTGIWSVDPGQREAGLSSGFTEGQVMWYIILPQAFKTIIPPLGNQFINLIKNSSILAMVSGFDLMYQGDLIASETFNTFDSYIIVGLLYLILTLPLSYLMRYLEKHWRVRA